MRMGNRDPLGPSCGYGRHGVEHIVQRLLRGGVLKRETKSKAYTPATYSFLRPSETSAKSVGRPARAADVELRDQEAAQTLSKEKWCEFRDSIKYPLSPKFEQFGSWRNSYKRGDKHQLGVVKAQKAKKFRLRQAPH